MFIGRALILVLTILGIADAGYLTYEHSIGSIPTCGIGSGLFDSCGTVLTSSYAAFYGIPLALIGVVFYTFEFYLAILAFLRHDRMAKRILVMTSTGGLVMSLYFVYLQVFVIRALCQYCMGSALISAGIFGLTYWVCALERKSLTADIGAIVYRFMVKPMLFRFNPECVHVMMTKFGALLGRSSAVRSIVSFLLKVRHSRLRQEIEGIEFDTPIGLAAGFDYEADLTAILNPLGFGYQTVGTITHHPYEGNPAPMLGRLPKSRSLMVNKGFKNLGASVTIHKLSQITHTGVFGVSIGRTNTKSSLTQKQSVQDIVRAFELFEESDIPHDYYELNISCPNLYGTVEFYSPRHLEQLLSAVDKLKISRPIFIKMPIEKTKKEYKDMLDVIIRHCPAGVIIGNLAKDRANPVLVAEEVAKFDSGNFSGKPTWESSNELISYTYAHYRSKLVIIGCGGVFTAADAYEKIRRGASLVQLVTGMIYQGPQIATQINTGLLRCLERDGYDHVSEAIGVAHGK